MQMEAERRLARAKQEVPTFRQHASEEHEEPKQRPSRVGHTVEHPLAPLRSVFSWTGSGLQYGSFKT